MTELIEVSCKVLGKVGLSENIANIIRSMYKDIRAKYRLGSVESEWVRSERGVRQGCILSPTLFRKVVSGYWDWNLGPLVCIPER